MATDEMTLLVEGMTCNNCAAGIQKSLRKIGFEDAEANFASGEVVFTLAENGRKLTVEDAIENIESLGYSIKSEKTAEGKLSAVEKKFLLALVFTVPLFMHMFVPASWWLNNPAVQFALALPVYIIGVAHFGRSAWGSLKAGVANMDVLIFIGSSAAFFYSTIGTWMFRHDPVAQHDFLFFETAATIITLVLLGNVLEHRSVKQTGKRIGELTSLKKTKARIVMRVGEKEKIFEADPDTVKVGDELQVNEGDYFAVDGTLLRGTALVDEAAITGESDPVMKNEGDPVYSGTTLVSGTVRITATKPAKDSTLSQIIDLVKRARRDHPEIQILGDRVSAIFVPVVLAIAALTFVLGYWAFDIGMTQALMNAVAVLVISCPCAMGLATPTAVVVGVGRAAKNGILIKGGSSLERFAKADVVVFDKTGTLTTGDFKVEFVENTLGPRSESLIKGLETHSSHPIATALVRAFESVEAETFAEVEEVKGEGMKGVTANGESVFIGKATGHADADLVLTVDGQRVAALNISDSLKAGAAQAVEAFNRAGIETIMLSGDRKEKVLRTAKELGIKDAKYSMSPEEKLKHIEKLSETRTVVMVGDGINDGPALSRAQVGVSPGGSTALAMESARVVLMNKNEMQALVDAFKISKHTYLTIKQNLFWAFFYNVVAIPIAAVGLLSPMIAALSMAFSDVIVVGNSLRLRRKKLS